MVFDGDLLVFDGVWSRLMFLLICFDGFSMGFSMFFSMGFWCFVMVSAIRFGRGTFSVADGIPLEVIMDSPVLKHRGKVCLAQWRKTWGKTMEGTFAKNFFGKNMTNKQLSSLFGVSQFQSSCCLSWKSNVKTKSGLIPYDVLSLFTSFHMICWSSADVLLGLFQLDPSIHWPHVWFSAHEISHSFRMCHPAILRARGSTRFWRGTGISSAARRPPCWTRMMRQMVSLPAGLTSGIGRREMLPAWVYPMWVGLFLRKSMEKCWKLTFEFYFTLKLSSKINLMSVEKSTWQLNAA